MHDPTCMCDECMHPPPPTECVVCHRPQGITSWLDRDGWCLECEMAKRERMAAEFAAAYPEYALEPYPLWPGCPETMVCPRGQREGVMNN